MTNSKELYKLLTSDFKTEETFYFASRGNGMMQGWERNSRRVFLINTNTKEAWELVTSNGCFSFWDKSAIEIASIFDLPYKAQRNAVEMKSPFFFVINDYKNGVASVSWTLQPDGCYYADGTGFGMNNDEEINLTAFIDQSANILIPFQPMEDQMKEQYRKQAEEIAKNRDKIPYICLSPDLTIPVGENVRIENHKEKLLKIIYGMMVQFGSLTENVDKHEECKERHGLFTAINPTRDNYLSLSIYGKKSEFDNEKYEVSILTVIFKKGQEPHGVEVIMGEFLPDEVVHIMMLEENAEIIYDEFIRMLKKLSV